MLSLATVIEWDALGKTIAASLIGGVGIISAFSLAIYGAASLEDRRRSGQTLAALRAGALMVAGLFVSVGGIIVGLVAVISG